MADTCIAIVLDRSGSMAGTEDATIKSVNSYLAEIKNDEGLKSGLLDMIIFDSQSVDTIRSAAVCDVAPLAAADFVPRGGTPLYDAIGRGIDTLDANLGKSGAARAVLVVMTDGFENSSRKHSHGSIMELIKAKQASGWLIVFLGADLASAAQGAALGVQGGFVANVAMTHAGLGNAMRSLSANTVGYAKADDAAVYASTMSFSEEEREAMADGGQVLAQMQPPPVKPTAQKPSRGDAWQSSRDAWSR